jgi:hypothetical protein
MERLVAVIELILGYHPKGLRVLVGEVEPTVGELDAILRCVLALGDGLPGRVAAAFSSSPSSPQERAMGRAAALLGIVEEAGGWGHLATAARFYREAYPQTWAIFADHVLTIAPGGVSRLEAEGQLARIARKHNVGIRTVAQKRQTVPEAIARYALLAPVEELTRLQSARFFNVREELPRRRREERGATQLVLPLWG